ncbi:MAG TPA: NUDIX domain-containing protein [Jatrophihabitans sp.]|nr:NUDIX domain-containing protein [Jatrophihabitans sp.]
MAAYVPCAGGIVFDGRRRLLLIQRGQPPSAGSWSIPGGRCLAGESPADACVREVQEETGLPVSVLRWAGRVERAAPDGRRYLIDDFVCTVVGSTEPDEDAALRAGDDALAARWVTRAEMSALPLAPGLGAALARWQLLPD